MDKGCINIVDAGAQAEEMRIGHRPIARKRAENASGVWVLVAVVIDVRKWRMAGMEGVRLAGFRVTDG
jgi:hypothetical protein